jgi:hypothetical protein
MISVDLIDYQDGRTEIPIFQVGKGEERRLSESLMDSVESSYQQGDMIEEDKKCILIIGGIEIFMSHSPVEARACVADATEEKRHLVVTIIKEKNEKTLKSAQQMRKGEEHSAEFLRNFNLEVE